MDLFWALYDLSYRNVLTEYGSDQLQTYLMRLVQWSETWQMSLDIEKCKVIHLGHNNRQTTYNMGQTYSRLHQSRKTLECLLMTNSISRSMCLLVWSSG